MCASFCRKLALQNFAKQNLRVFLPKIRAAKLCKTKFAPLFAENLRCKTLQNKICASFCRKFALQNFAKQNLRVFLPKIRAAKRCITKFARLFLPKIRAAKLCKTKFARSFAENSRCKTFQNKICASACRKFALQNSAKQNWRVFLPKIRAAKLCRTKICASFCRKFALQNFAKQNW